MKKVRTGRRRQFQTLRALGLGLFALAILFGGASAPDADIHYVVQGASIAMILGLAAFVPGAFSRGTLRWPLALAAAWLTICFLQLVPLPPALHALVPGSHNVRDAFALMDLETPAMPISVSPSRTVSGLLDLTVPLAVFLIFGAAIKLGPRATSIAVLSLVGVSVLVALGQTGLGLRSLYFYERTNMGYPVGLFANVNHQATLLLMGLPFAAAAIAVMERTIRRSRTPDMALLGLACASGLGALIGIVMTRSLAGLTLLLPVVACSATLLLDRLPRLRRMALLVIPGTVAVSMLLAIFAWQPLTEGLGIGTADAQLPDFERVKIWRESFPAVQDYWLFGSGVATFRETFALYEQPSDLGLTFANHAHNDYLEWLMEAGLVGVPLLLAFLYFLSRTTWNVWKSTGDGNYVSLVRRAASIAIWVPLAHSVVDYPMRTPAIMAFMALCLAIMVNAPPPDRTSRRRRSSRKAVEARTIEL